MTFAPKREQGTSLMASFIVVHSLGASYFKVHDATQ